MNLCREQKYDDPPKNAVGFYATTKCWDANEGIFPGAHYWNGDDWVPTTRASIAYYPKLFPSAEEAEEFAFDNLDDLK
jgi:hypothetical protein